MTKFERMAQYLFFNGGNIIEVAAAHGLALANGKTVGDVVDAYGRGMNQGMGKFEAEMMCAGQELSRVLKEPACPQ